MIQSCLVAARSCRIHVSIAPPVVRGDSCESFEHQEGSSDAAEQRDRGQGWSVRAPDARFGAETRRRPREWCRKREGHRGAEVQQRSEQQRLSIREQEL
jgi:hypothetical protein